MEGGEEQKNLYVCPTCDRVFFREKNRDMHIIKAHTDSNIKEKEEKNYVCPQCDAAFSRKSNRDRHVIRVHTNANLVHVCTLCGNVFDNVSKLKEHRNAHEPTTGFVLTESAFSKTCVVYRKKYQQTMKTLAQSFANDISDIQTLLEHELVKKKTIKASIVFHAEFLKPLDNDLSNLQPYLVCLRTSAKQLISKTDISHFAQVARETAQLRIDDFLDNGSGWTLDEIICTDVQIGACPPLNGSCSLLSIRHLTFLKKIKSSVSTKKNQCFYEAVALHFTKSKRSKTIHNFIRKHINRINPRKDQPVNVLEIKKFEKMNEHLKCSINVLYAEDEDVYPIYSSKNINAEHCINLLLYKIIVDEQVVDHYLYVEDINIFLRREYRGTHRKKSYERSLHCPNCLQKFSHESNLIDHQEICMNNKPQKIKIPEKGETLEFSHFNNKFCTSFIGFFDFEASQEKPQFACEKCGEEPCIHKSVIETIQEPITYSLLIIETETNKVFDKKTYTGMDCASHLLNHLLSIEERLLAEMNKFPLYSFTRKERRMIENSSTCHICEKEFCEGEEKVGDHCHTTGKLFGAAHNLCNLLRRVKKNIPMFCHNLQGYDSHFIVQCLKPDDRITNVNGLAYNSEKFRTLTLNSFVFLDSLSFLSASLSELVNDLTQNKDHKFTILDQLNLYGENEEKKKNLIIRKGVYPYESVTGIEMLIETKRLPPIADFYSSLTDTTVSSEDYKHALKVFKKFKCENLLQYTELYCATDVGLLAEVMIQFRNLVLSKFGLDCCHYVSTPQMAFDGMLKMTKVKIELLSDIDQVLFVEQNIRGK
jgi:uncharacterized C2H2 Zn-finger protein